jgi:ABC-type uncharacterized transport system permease subunit
MFSESKVPVSELIQGDPDKPVREPVLALFAIVFNLFSIYQINEMLRQMMLWYNPSDPFMWSYYSILSLTFATLNGFTIFYSIMLLIGAAVMRFIHRRAGAVIVLVFSIFVLFVSFVAIAFAFSLFIGTIIGMAAGIIGIRSRREERELETVEII